MSTIYDYAPMLYVPANRPGLVEYLIGEKARCLRNVAICIEDAVRPGDRRRALSALGRRLPMLFSAEHLHCFLRLADTPLLNAVLQISAAGRFAGFILPKATPQKLCEWIELTRGQFPIVPILETREILSPCGRMEMASACTQYRSTVARIRIGANDLFSLLGGLRRPRGKTLYETPVGHVIDGIIETFSGLDLPLSGSVFDRLDDPVTLLRECREDIDRGLFCKAAINPSQVLTISDAYRPAPSEIEEAARILDPDAPAVFALNGAMQEPACHASWAQNLLRRAAAFGLNPVSQEPLVPSSDHARDRKYAMSTSGPNPPKNGSHAKAKNTAPTKAALQRPARIPK